MKLFFTALAFILLFLASSYTTSLSQIIWTKDNLHNPVLAPGVEGEWDDVVLLTFCILFDDNTLCATAITL